MKFWKLIFILPLIASCGFEVVDDGFVGIKKSMGKISKEEYPAGLHFYTPFVNRIFEMEIREQSYEDTVVAYSADNQIIQAKYRMNVKPDPKMMAELYITLGDSYVQKLLPQRVKSSIKEVLGNHKATTLVTVRGKVDEAIKTLLMEKMEGTSLSLTSFNIVNYDYDDDFEAAVKRKIIAKERAVEEVNRTVQIKEQAAQKVLQAKADAEAIRVKTKALAKSKDIIELEAVKKWDGKLPVYMMGGKSMPFIKLDSRR